MNAQEETQAVIAGLVNPPGLDLIQLAAQDTTGAELALIHIELMRDAGEVIPPSLLALELYLTTHRPTV